MAGSTLPPPGEQQEEEEGGEEFAEDEDDEEDDDPVRDIQRFMEDMGSGCDDATKEEAIGMLKHLYVKFKCGYGITCAILNAGAIRPLVAFVESGTEAQKEQAADLLASLAYTSRLGLVCNSGLKNEVRALGGFEPLAALVTHGGTSQQEHAAAALENLGVTPQDREEIAQACGGCAALVALVKEGSPCQKELAVRMLRAMTVDGHQEAIRDAAGVLATDSAQVEARGAEGKVIDMPEVSVF
uniref:Armadillo repeat-containing domain-containing protein n=1 Tax=Alexandrium monilatum TaxID=311494 RepID=A0A7S4VCI7_9DINO